jgi:hypothetical protein
VAVEEELTGGMGTDTPGATWTDMAVGPAEGVPVAELLLLAASGIAAASAEAGLGADGTVGTLATGVETACEGPAAPAAGRSTLTWIGVVVEPFDAAAVLVAVVTADFFPAVADSRTGAVGDAAAICKV